MNRSAPRILLAAVAAAFVWPDALAAQRTNYDYGVLLAPRVPCREAPSSGAGVSSILRLTGNGSREPVAVRASAVDTTGATWILVRQSPPLWQEWCWVPETHVRQGRGDPNALLLMADRLLAAPDGLQVADWVAVHNYFRHWIYREDDASAVLSLRRIEVLKRALDAAQAELPRDRDPRFVAWVESLGEEVEAIEDRFGQDRWVVSRNALDALHEAHREDPLAEEILWKVARYSPQPVDCPRSLSCVFEGPLSDVARYWLAYPDGRFVGEAIGTALTWLRRAGNALSGYNVGGILNTCEEARDAEPGGMYRLSRRWWDELAWEAAGDPAARRLLATLSEVGDEEKAPLVDYLDRVERCALEVAARPPPEESPRPRAAATVEQESTTPAETREFAVIAPDVSCRAEPSRTARGHVLLRLDEHFTTDRPDTVAAGEAWVRVPDSGCWVPRAETASLEAGDHVLAIADRFLASGEVRTLEHSLRVYNVLGGRHRGYRDIVDGSAVLSLRRLQILGEVLRRLVPFYADALMRGWAEQLVDDVRYFEPGARWYVRDEAFQRLYDSHRGSPEAEDVLWELVTGPSPHDCEGLLACTVGVTVMEKFARYWTDYPRGRHVGQAIETAAARVDGFLRTCEAARGAEPDSREAQWWEWTEWDPSGAETAAALRETLANVPSSDAEPLTAVLDRLEACAAAVGGGSV